MREGGGEEEDMCEEEDTCVREEGTFDRQDRLCV
jgi:hypothetical protein